MHYLLRLWDEKDIECGDGAGEDLELGSEGLIAGGVGKRYQPKVKFLFFSFFACPKKEQKKAPTKPTAKFSYKLPVRLKSSFKIFAVRSFVGSQPHPFG
jgi:hypothetical protein